MKQANEIVKHLFFASSDKLSKSRFFLRAIELMPKTLADELLFCYMKGKTLFFVTKNHSMVFELNYKLKSLKEALRLLADMGGFDDFRDFDDIKTFATKYDQNQTPPSTASRTYLENERSSGKFEVHTSNDRLSRIFEEIREMIKKQ